MMHIFAHPTKRRWSKYNKCLDCLACLHGRRERKSQQNGVTHTEGKLNERVFLEARLTQLHGPECHDNLSKAFGRNWQSVAENLSLSFSNAKQRASMASPLPNRNHQSSPATTCQAHSTYLRLEHALLITLSCCLRGANSNMSKLMGHQGRHGL